MLREIMKRLEVAPGTEEAVELESLFRKVDEGDEGVLLAAGFVTLRAGLPEMAADFIERSMRAGDVDGGVELASLAARIGATELAIRMFDVAEECGFERVEFKTAEALLLGDRVDEAAERFQRLASAGEPGADFYLGVIAMRKDDLVEAERHFRRSVDLGETEGVLNLGMLYERRGEHDAAREWYGKAREVGDENAYFSLGTMEADLGNEDEAIRYLEIAASEGNERASAQLELMRLRRGEAVDHDAMLRAAESGIPEAMVNLAIVLPREGDYDGARTWFTRAIDAGSVPAMMELAMMEAGFADVRVITGEREPDLDAAKRYWLMAAEAGEPAGFGRLALVAMQDGNGNELDRLIHLGLAAAPEAITLLNVEEVAAGSSDFEIPPREMRERFEPGQVVKLMWSDGTHVERMWALILRNDDGRYVGTLDNDPLELDVRPGTLVAFGPEHIMERPPTSEEQAEQWKRFSETGERSRGIPEGVTQARYDEIAALAEQGDLDAMRSMIDFAERNGDQEMRVLWCERAGELGDGRSLLLLGARAYEARDFAEAERLWLRAIGEESLAMLFLATLSRDQGDEGRALDWLRRGAEAGNAKCATELGRSLIDHDTVQARMWLEQAVEARNADAMLLLSRLEVADGDEDHAKTLLALAAELGNQSAASLLDDFDDYREAIELHRSYFIPHLVAEQEAKAEDGDAEALAWLLGRAASLDLDDQRVPLLELGMSNDIAWAFDLMGDERNRQGDVAGAVEMWERAAERGDSDSMYSLGHVRAHAGDWAGATEWYEQGSNLGHAECASMLGEIAMNGQRLDEAVNLLRLAVERGSSRGKFLLGVVLIQLDQPDEAMRLIADAAQAGEEDALQFLQRLDEGATT